ncbi:hypothetical protein SHJG_p1091 (plasmid) [Streptomyces hygroscopicus subsp. jinggangensis 5008]|nr:hypothetical protein SHJG_p1091 [Streptomyces hygroscopicus subsp. jinggangensis 5008]AGF68376.1 hypothetical protein SHJGH_p1091 [Streptomyces hygroscopicus subsp. jinggangensis TL01]
MADQDQDLVDVDPYNPDDGSLPVFRWKQAGCDTLATRRQLREMGLSGVRAGSPRLLGGREPAFQQVDRTVQACHSMV